MAPRRSFDVGGALMTDGFDGEYGERKEECITSATIGLTYNFSKRNWDKEKIVQITTYDEAELNILRRRVQGLVHD